VSIDAPRGDFTCKVDRKKVGVQRRGGGSSAGEVRGVMGSVRRLKNVCTCVTVDPVFNRQETEKQLC